MVKNRLADFVGLIKPRILSLLVYVSMASILVAWPQPVTWADAGAIAILVGKVLGFGILAAGSANVFNNILDRDIDARMARTRTRAIPAGRVSVVTAVILGTLLGVAAFAGFWVWVNPMSAWLVLAGIGYYVIIYTLILKRTTTQNIVVGGLAGSCPALVGWAAVTGDISLVALLLGLIVFMWTPPHFWALAMVYRDDYGRARIPMMPTIHGVRRTQWEILAYSIGLVVTSILLAFPLGALGWLYLISASILGILFITYAVKAFKDPGDRAQWALFKYSILYLFLLFGAMVIDRVFVPLPI